MAYTVLARKYRSRTFDEVIGQEPIATTLVNAIKTGRIHHGYLFTGTRGVGKTSMARILAKALNCLKAEAPTATPCCECDACTAIAEGQDIDVIEIDAASHTGVDNIRELRSNTAYRPARSRFKVYIIDEVHMLSTGAFNALLKTLEEPPEHVKFILATTEIQKVPATIQSRCQRFNFRNIGPEAIARQLAVIVEQEGAAAEDAVLRRIARLARGSMRDALSILDQLLSVSPQRLTAQVLDEILPPAQDEQLFGLVKHAAGGDVAAVLSDVEGVLEQGRGLELLCNDTIEVVRSLMLIRACGPDAAMVDVPAIARDDYVELSRQFELSQYVQMIAMLEELRRSVRYSGAGRALTDALMVRLARMREWAPIERLLAEYPAGDAAAGEKKKRAPDQPAVARAATPARRARAEAGAAPAAETTSGVTDTPPRTVAAPPQPPPVAVDVNVADYDGGPVEIPDDHGPAEALPARTLREAISEEERVRILKDPVVRQVLELFDGELVDAKRRSPQPTTETRE